MANPMYGQNKSDNHLDMVSPIAGVVVPTMKKSVVGAGAFPDLAVNTHYMVTGTITASTKTLPAGTKGDVIYIEMVSETGEYRLATPDEESKGIDGVVDGKYVSIKPHTYKKTIEAGKETINYDIIYYKNTKKGLVVTQ